MKDPKQLQIRGGAAAGNRAYLNVAQLAEHNWKPNQEWRQALLAQIVQYHYTDPSLWHFLLFTVKNAMVLWCFWMLSNCFER